MKTAQQLRYKQAFVQLNNRGSVLIISLIFLVILTLLGLSTAKTRTMSLKLTGNTQDNNLALQRAESALREAEESMTGAPGIPGPPDVPPTAPTRTIANFDGNTTGLLQRSDTLPDELKTANAIPTTADDGSTFYVIQLTDKCVSPGAAGAAGADNFCVTAQSSGNYPNTTVVLQTLLKK